MIKTSLMVNEQESDLPATELKVLLKTERSLLHYIKTG